MPFNLYCGYSGCKKDEGIIKEDRVFFVADYNAIFHDKNGCFLLEEHDRVMKGTREVTHIVSDTISREDVPQLIRLGKIERRFLR